MKDKTAEERFEQINYETYLILLRLNTKLF